MNQEHIEQAALVTWAEMSKNKYPELQLLFAIPNGGKLPYTRINGKVLSPQRIQLVKEGLKSGVPDLCLPVARNNLHGLFIEMKAGKNKPTEEQLEWKAKLTEQGYLSVVCWGFESAKKVILEYIQK
jgi:hypothetical protein